MTTREKIEEVLEILPELTDFGIGLYDNGRGLSVEEYRREFEKEQELLLRSTKEFEKVCKWLSKIDKINTISKNSSSYGLASLAKKEVGYFTNGVFIAAAVYSGFKFQLCRPGSPNMYFGMSKKSISVIKKKYRPSISY